MIIIDQKVITKDQTFVGEVHKKMIDDNFDVNNLTEISPVGLIVLVSAGYEVDKLLCNANLIDYDFKTNQEYKINNLSFI